MRTEDGYILSMQRIPEGREGDGGSGQGRPPVLLQHGVLMVYVCVVILFLVSMP